MKIIAHITDIHLDEAFSIEQGINPRENWALILEDVAARNIKNIVFGGDIGEPASNKWFFDSFKPYSFNVDITLGNHDVFTEAGKHYSNQWMGKTDGLYYSYEDEYFRYIFLDSSINSISDSQFLWFEQQLDTPKKIMLHIHHPVLEVDTAADKKYSLSGREKIQDALRKHHKDVVILCGHYHMAHVQTKGNITQYITPASSFQMERNRNTIQISTQTFGYSIIQISEDTINTETILFR